MEYQGLSAPKSSRLLLIRSEQFPLDNIPWPSEGLRRASVNSFGYGGANAHVVLDDAYNYMKLRGISGKHCTVLQPPVNRTGIDSTKLENKNQLGNCSHQANGFHHGSLEENFSKSAPKLLVWSSSDEAGINRLSSVYHDHLSGLHMPASFDSEKYFADLTYTLASKRSQLPWKSYLISQSIEDLTDQLLTNLSTPVRSTSAAPKLGFVFSGQGVQWHAMGRELLLYPVFESSLQQSDKHLKLLGCQWSLIGKSPSASFATLLF